MQFWTADEVGRILGAADGEYLAAYFWLAFDSGMRPGELLGLHWDAVDLDARTVRVVQSLEDINGDLRLKEPKTTKGKRVVRLTEGTVAALTAHREAMRAKGRDVTTGPVFVGQRNGRLMTHSTFYGRYFRPVLAAAAVPAHSPYATRHTCATLLLAAGVGVKVVTERLGHEDIVTTLRHYGHTLPDAQETAAKAWDGIIAGVKASRLAHGDSEQADTLSYVI